MLEMFAWAVILFCSGGATVAIIAVSILMLSEID